MGSPGGQQSTNWGGYKKEFKNQIGLLNFELKVNCDQKAVLKSDFIDPDFL